MKDNNLLNRGIPNIYPLFLPVIPIAEECILDNKKTEAKFYMDMTEYNLLSNLKEKALKSSEEDSVKKIIKKKK